MSQWKIALRSLGRRASFAGAVVVLLAAGIGVNVALFSLVYTVLLKPLPYPAPEQLVTVYEASAATAQKTTLIAPARLDDWNRLNSTFEAIAGSYSENVTDTSGTEPQRLSGLRVSSRYFAVFAAPPLLGRTFTTEEERNGGPLAAVITYGLWTRRYGQDLGVIGRQMLIAGKAYAIVGVMPNGAAPPAVDLWLPAQTPPFILRMRDARFLGGVGRLRAGVSIERARQDLARVQQRLAEQFPQTDKGWSAAVGSLKEARIGTSAGPLLLLFGAVAALLLITLTNTASLMLAQLLRRRPEFSVRASLGATPVRVVGAVMREVAILAVTSTMCGLLLANALVRLLPAVFADVPRIAELQMNGASVAFAVAIALVAASVFGLLPAFLLVGRGHGLAVRDGRGVAGRGRRVQACLVAAQIAVTLVLLTTAGLLMRSVHNLRGVDLGFDATGTVTFHVGAAWNEDRARVGDLQERVVAALQRLAGVKAVGITNFLPASGATLRYQATLEGEANDDLARAMPVGYRTVTAGYLQAIRAPLVAGTWCPDFQADFNAPRKAIVNRRFVEVYGHGRNVLGRRIEWAELAGKAPQQRDEVVGVIGDIREDGLDQPPYPYVYACAVAGAWPDPDYVVRATADPSTVLRSVRHVVAGVDSSRAVFGARPLEQYLDAVLERPRSNAAMMALFAGAAMMLAAVGLYGLVAQMVGLRRREIGVRMALGARPGRIVGSLLAGAGRLIAVGVAGGIALMFAVRRLLTSMVFGVSALDVVTLGVGALLLVVVSTLAAFVASRRASRVDPLEALRAE